MENELLKIINGIYKRNGKRIILVLDRGMSLRNDLGFDSIDLAELTVKIEDKFGVDIFEDTIVDSISDVIKKIQEGN